MTDLNEQIQKAIRELGDDDKIEFEVGQWVFKIESTEEPVSRTLVSVDRTSTFHNQNTRGNHRFYSNGIYNEIDRDGDVVEDE